MNTQAILKGKLKNWMGEQVIFAKDIPDICKSLTAQEGERKGFCRICESPHHNTTYHEKLLTPPLEGLFEDYEQWLSEWDGDYPNEREHATFLDWLEAIHER